MVVQVKKQHDDWLDGRAGDSNVRALASSWKSLWGIKIPSKIKVSAWRLVHNSIPTDLVRMERDTSNSKHWRICGAVEDYWEHALL